MTPYEGAYIEYSPNDKKNQTKANYARDVTVLGAFIQTQTINYIVIYLSKMTSESYFYRCDHDYCRRYSPQK